MLPTNQIFAKALRIVREEKGLSQEKLAELSQLDRTTISTLETGKADVRFSTILKLIDALNISIMHFAKRLEEVRKIN